MWKLYIIFFHSYRIHNIEDTTIEMIQLLFCSGKFSMKWAWLTRRNFCVSINFFVESSYRIESKVFLQLNTFMTVSITMYHDNKHGRSFFTISHSHQNPRAGLCSCLDYIMHPSWGMAGTLFWWSRVCLPIKTDLKNWPGLLVDPSSS